MVKREMLLSLSKIDATQTFHLIFFNEGIRDEFKYKKLVPATTKYIREAVTFLAKVHPKGSGTNPLPALERAFDVLAKADRSKKGKMIFLLTDGEFYNVTRDKLLRDIKRMNKKNDVAIFTFLYRFKSDNPSDPDSIESVLRAIAGGKEERFTHIRD